MKKIFLVMLVKVLLLGFIYSSAMAEDLVVALSGGAMGEAVKKCLIKPYEQATGLRVVFEAVPDITPKLKAMVKSKNVTVDVTETHSLDLLILLAEQGLLEPLDYKVIDTTDILDVGIHPYGLANVTYSTVLAYNSAKYPKEKRPKSWRDFWDVKEFPGDRALYNNPVNNLEFALMADGVPPNKLYPLDLERAFRSLDRIKPHVKVWWTAGAQPAQLLTDGEVDMASAWNGRIWAVQKQGAQVGIEWNQGIMMYSVFCVPKGTPHKKTAMEFLNFCMKPKHQACLTESIGYPMFNKKIFDFLDPKIAPNFPTYPENYKKQIVMNYEWWGKNREKVDDLWEAWIIK